VTVTGDPRRPLQSTGENPSVQGHRRDAAAVLEVCPFLAAEDASWRSAYAAREHRCQAVRPAAPLAIDKQRQLCLLAAHRSCATFLAAQTVAGESLPPTPGDDGAALWLTAQTAPLVLEPARRMSALPTGSVRSGGQAVIIGLMVVAFLVLVIARTQAPAGAAAMTPPASGNAVAGIASVTGAPGVTNALDEQAVRNEDTPTAATQPTGTAGAIPTGTPSATATTRRYRVRSGDTLTSIAAKYDTTVKKLRALNDIDDPRTLKIGQVLRVP